MTELKMANLIHAGKTLTDKTLSEIENNVLEEPCEICGQKTRDCGQLFAKDTTDEEGRKIVLMLCAQCSTKTN